MNIEDITNAVREELTHRPTDEEVRAGVRTKVVAELGSKQDRIHSLEVELEAARESLRETEAQVAALEVHTEEVQG